MGDGTAAHPDDEADAMNQLIVFLLFFVALVQPVFQRVYLILSCKWRKVFNLWDVYDVWLVGTYALYVYLLGLFNSEVKFDMPDEIDFMGPVGARNKMINQTLGLFDTAETAKVWKQDVDFLSIFFLFLLLLRFFRCIVFQPQLALMTRTIVRSATDLQAFMVVFGASFFVFSLCSQILFGARVQEYATLSTSLESNWHMMLGAWDRDQMALSVFYDSGEGSPRYYLPQIFFLPFLLHHGVDASEHVSCHCDRCVCG